MERFFKYVKKTSLCWEWIGGSRGVGYGAFKYQGKVYDAHRFAWFLKHGSFSKLWILHKCNNRRCVNPEHLYEGTPKQNYADMKLAGNEPERKNKIYSTRQEQKRAAFRRWYEKIKNEPGRARYNRWRASQKKKYGNREIQS